jgi:hypothetical protein
MASTVYGGGGATGTMRGWADSQVASGNTSTGLNYPSPFLKFEGVYIPKDMKELMSLIAHSYLTDSNINPAIENMSAYPITKLEYIRPENIDDLDVFKPIEKYWQKILDKDLDVRSFNISMGYDYFGYGNAFMSVYQPFDRWLKCSTCKKDHCMSQKNTTWKWKNLKFYVDCKFCGYLKEATFFDKPRPVSQGINLVKWNPFNMQIKHIATSGRNIYKYAIPNDVKAAITKGDPDYLKEVPGEFIKAVVNSLKGKGEALITFDEGQIFALQRPSISLPGGACVGWGVPLAASSLRDIFFKNVMRRAQAMVLNEHIIPFRVFSPSVMEQPSVMANMASWRSNLESSYYKWRANPVNIMTSPIPINVQQVGGNGKALTLFAEMQETDKSIIKGMNIPREFVEGGLTYSGSSVSIRMLENILHDYVQRSNRMINWIVKKISELTGVVAVEVQYTKFKMADDVQVKSLYANLQGNKTISAKKLGDIFDFDSDAEIKQVAEEQALIMIEQARAQAKAQYVLNQVTQEYSNAMPTVMGNFKNPMDPSQTQQLKQQVENLPPDQQQNALGQLSQQDPYAAQTVGGAMGNKQELAHDIQTMENLAPEQAEMAMEELYYKNPTKYNMMKLFFVPGSSKADQLNGVSNRVAGAPTLSPAPGLPVNMQPAPEQRPPRGPFRSM